MGFKTLCRGSSNEFVSDENTIRGTWSHKLDFILSLIGYTVGFGNVWRFPYLCYRNGGGAFLVPYFLVLAIAGLPLFYMELALGQYSSQGPIAVWKLAPLFKGIGITAVTVTGIINAYYNTLVAYVLYYLFASMTSQLPWSTCGNPWNTADCRVPRGVHIAINATLNMTNITNPVISTAAPLSGESDIEALGNGSTLFDVNITRPRSPAEEYFERHVLELTSGIDEIGSIRWQLLLCLILSWVIAFLCLLKGIKSTGKVVYFTAVYPYIVLTILLIRGVTLEGSFEGLKYYLIPDWSKLKNPKVWGDAAAQIFYSLGPAWGCLIAFASYNKFHNNFHRDAIICSLVCCGTSLFAGLVIFSVIGFMAHDLNVPVSEVMASGPGLAFVAYPEAVARMPIAPFWAIVFFSMLLTAGLDSMFAQIEVVVVAITDEFPQYLRQRKTLFLLVVCIFYFLLGIPQVTQGGMYILNLIDWYFATFALFIIAFLEAVCVMYIYGSSNLAANIELMIGSRPNIFYRVCLGGLTPGIVLAICVFNAIIYTPAVYNDYTYPVWANNVGWAIALIPVAAIPLYMIFYYLKRMGSLQAVRENLAFPWTGATLRELAKPSKDWGPMMPEYRKEAGLDLTESQEMCLKQKMPTVTLDENDVTCPLSKSVMASC